MYREEIDKTLEELLPKEAGVLFEAARYSLEGGKRIRPLLALAVASSFDVPIEKVLHPACVLELVHTYSLIHDDLPCMDDDDFRRNKPSLHKAYPESHAVLTGDFLLTYAFEVLAKALHLSFEEKNALVLILSQRAGAEGMIGGQILDMENSSDIFQTHLKKTGALITACLEFGAILAKQELAPFQKMGEHLGIAFQLTDDLLDNETTLGEEKTKQLLEEHYENALAVLHSLNHPALFLEELMEKMIFRSV